ncbi:unnamed protein product [Vitrella brassicaformis CCMP3155]|uniref:Uncharacterized protein n=1 Tax=Vitrella brassicaformis (strain CCMP3155) TaxID=1169540 RepID=A0A0G4GPJ6_VITBC|nr:unnamed protein product [Vitrella brassicaformis CCMP3155]|eukprot:CEM32284.1 unnamed protein product [Vitrella brassicaformis CCMP3155]
MTYTFPARWGEAWWFEGGRRDEWRRGEVVVVGTTNKKTYLQATLWDRKGNGKRGELIAGPFDLDEMDIDKFESSDLEDAVDESLKVEVYTDEEPSDEEESDESDAEMEDASTGAEEEDD